MLIAVGIRKFAAVISGQFVGVDLLEHGVGPLFPVVREHLDFVLRALVQERLDHRERQAEDFRCCSRIGKISFFQSVERETMDFFTVDYKDASQQFRVVGFVHLNELDGHFHSW